jgi:hypothetical protein
VVRAVLDDCYDSYDTQVGSAFKNPTGTDSHLTRHGDAAPSKFVENNLDWLSAADDDSTRDKREAEYQRYDAALRDAWRRPG